METTIRTKIVQVYSDPAHGWAKVRLKDLFILGIHDKISSYSYEKNDHVYLEEDSDLNVYISALKSKGIMPKFKNNWTNRRSKIRSYGMYTPN